jgi:Ca2+-binding EF-hand superfamily protein
MGQKASNLENVVADKDSRKTMVQLFKQYDIDNNGELDEKEFSIFAKDLLLVSL